MSFPFVVPIPDTPQPPPTGGPLNIIARANTTAPYAAGGGGGPSTIGPNPVVSSITLGGANPVVNMADGGLLFTTNGFDTTSTIVGIEYNPTAPSGSGIGGPDFSVIQAGTLNTYPVLDLGLGGDGRILLALNSTMSIVGDSVNISSLNVSSINGAAPGGGSVPANLELSTLTMGIPGSITGVSSLVGGGGILSVGDQLAVSSITGLGNALLLDGAGYAINVAGSAVNIPAAPVTISTATISSINGAAPGALPNNLTLSTLAVSSLNGGVPAVFQFQSFTTYTQGASSCTLGPSYYSLVNGVGNLVLTFPETPGASWAGANKYITFGTNFNSGGMPSTWNFDNVSISCPDATGAYSLNSWVSQVGGNQLTFNLNVGGTPSTFAITAQVRLP